jgi:hypothetical protein
MRCELTANSVDSKPNDDFMRLFKIFLLLTFTFFSVSSFSIRNESTAKYNLQFEYYIYISGVTERGDVLSLQELIQKKEGVSFFMAERFPVRCFVLKSNRLITEAEFKKWIPEKYIVESFGQGNHAKEAAYRIYNQNKKSNQKR